MDQQEYDEKNRNFEHAIDHLKESVNELYACGSYLRAIHDGATNMLDCMLDGAKKMIEDWVNVIEHVRQSFESENCRDFDDVVVDWMRVNGKDIHFVTETLYGFDDGGKITDESVEEWLKDILDRGLRSMRDDAERAFKEVSE